jgi:hypothetical protein
VTARTITYLVEFVALFLVWTTFTISYHVVSRGAWRKTPTGRHLMSMGASLSVIGAQIIANLFLGEYPGRFAVGIVLYGSLVLVGVRQLFLLLHARRQRDLEERGERSSATR